MKRNLVIWVLIVLVLIFAGLAFSSKSSKEKSVKQSHAASVLSASGEITCTYPQVMQASYQSAEITHQLPKPETNPIIMTFSDIHEKVSKIKFIDSTRTISEVPIIKVVETAEKLMFLEGNGDPYMTVHTIYKSMGVASYAKSISLLGTPAGTIAMGTCVDY